MTHDPLCGLAQPCDEEEPEHGYCSMQHGLYCIHCHQWCICTELRACEQRVLKDLVPNLQIADTQGFNRGLRQAREAVEGCRTDLRGYLDKTDALAAIDALRGES